MNHEKVRNEIDKIMKEHGWNIKEVSELVDVSATTMGRFLSKRHKPKSATLMEIAKVLELSENQIEQKIIKEKNSEKVENFDIEIKNIKIKDCGNYLLVKKNGKEIKITF